MVWYLYMKGIPTDRHKDKEGISSTLWYICMNWNECDNHRRATHKHNETRIWGDGGKRRNYLVAGWRCDAGGRGGGSGSRADAQCEPNLGTACLRWVSYLFDWLFIGELECRNTTMMGIWMLSWTVNRCSCCCCRLFVVRLWHDTNQKIKTKKTGYSQEM